MSPTAIKNLLIGLAFVAAISLGYFVVTSYNDAITEAKTLRDQNTTLQRANSAWEQREKELLDQQAADAKRIEEKEKERAREAARVDRMTREYTNALKNLSPEDRAAADRRVPAAVDRLLGVEDEARR